jgi:hypothetical protein
MRADGFIKFKETFGGNSGNKSLDMLVVRFMFWAGRYWFEICDMIFRKLAFKSFAKNS